MRTLLSLLTIILIAFCSDSKAQQVTYSLGKYLVQTKDAGKQENNEKMVMELMPNGVLSILLVNRKKPMIMAKLKPLSKTKIAVEFNPFFDKLSGDYTLKYLSKNRFKLYSELGEMLFFPFDEEKVIANNKAMNIEGTWHFKDNEEEITLTFSLPNQLHIQKKKKYSQKSGDVFWISQSNGKEITISASLFFNVFSGTLQQVKIKENQLHFTYKGKKYALQKKS